MSDLSKREEEILEFWTREQIFQKTLEKPSPRGEYVFYDGPPFATGLPHYGHLLQSALKDAMPRFFTMQGYRVARRWGWDCHGLPLENQIEQELKIKTKRDIEAFGIGKFNAAARAAVMRYANEWKQIIARFGRWVDMENDYRTMDASYTESVWWAFKNLHERGLLYEDFKSMHLCPRCGTTLSNFEVAQGYKDIEDFAVTVKLPLVDEPDTSLLVWTTTPWTLPGNSAAAVKADAMYVKVKVGDSFVITAQALAPEGEVVEEFEGKKLVGKKYDPPFDYFKSELHKHKTHAWKVYAADFVTLEEGTGVVHIAPAFGADDLSLAQKEKIPPIHHVTDEGKFITTVRDFAGLSVKPKGNPKETDAKIVEHLKERGLLFKEEKIKHSYPHCWRCDTPLLNWAANSWFVNVQKIKSKLLKENSKVHWVPEHVGRGRFNNGLESAPDWAISRARFWGAPIPVWRHTKRKEIKVAGSLKDLLGMVRRSGNRYFVMRHGEAQSNVSRILDSDGREDNHLTDKGKNEVVYSAQELKKENIDLIITSPILRTRETGAIVQHELGLPDSAVMVDERLRERGLGSYNGKTVDEWRNAFKKFAEEFTQNPGDAEDFISLRKRTGELLFEIERRYTNKNILIVTHGDPFWALRHVAKRTPAHDLANLREPESYPNPARWEEVPFVPFPHNENYELDLHRPYIDEIPMGNSIDGQWKRVPEVFDCWFESGSMPFASNHYPFETKDFNPKRFFGFGTKGYPADFIAESIDQTRGWFYSLIVLGVGLFGKSPYKAVVTNGLVLASDGRKMSKRFKNYPDPMEVVEKYGADALRYYLLSSSVIRGEDLRFNERGVDEVAKKLLMRLDNVRSFYELYASKTSEELSSSSPHLLDKWILSRLSEVVHDTTVGFETYALDRATRPLGDFIDDLSTWYLRRSRDRFKEEGADKVQALATLRQVLITVAQAMSPVMPFFAESLYQAMRAQNGPESVHLCEWPGAGDIDAGLLGEMRKVRSLASKGLELREKAGIKVRQPLAAFETNIVLSDELKDILKDELNVKEIRLNPELAVLEDRLDTEITPQLKEEGMLRELIRKVQEQRKEQGYTIADRPSFTMVLDDESAAVAHKYMSELLDATNLQNLEIQKNV